MTFQNKKNPTGLAALSGYRNLISDLIHDAPGGFAVVSPDGQILYANHSAAEYIRNAADISAALHTDDRQTLEFTLTRLRLDPSRNQRAEMRFIRADGSDYWVIADFSPARLNAHGGLEEIFI